MKTALLCLVLLCVGFVSIGFCQKTKKRDLAVYDDGGMTDFGFRFMPDHKIRGARLRDFIWTHFNEKRLGHIKAAFYSIEGDPVYDHIFIEPDAKGTWQVLIDSEQHCCWTYALERPRKRRTIRRWTEMYLAADRTKATYNGIGRSSDFAGEDRLLNDDATPSSRYRLILRRIALSDIIRNF